MGKNFLFIMFVLFISIFIFAVFSNLVSAEIIISQPASNYSLGDNLKINVEVSEIKQGFLEINLVCGNSKNIYRSILTQKKIDLNIPLIRIYIDDLKGNCYIRTTYSGEDVKSSGFTISDKLIVNANIDKTIYDPGENVKIQGEVLRENGEKSSGFLNIKLKEANIDILSIFENGEFNANFTLPDNIAGDSYEIKIKAYEKINDEITNQGTQILIAGVRKKPTRIDLIVSHQNLKPGTNMSLNAVLYDQADNEMDENIGVVIRDPDDNEVFNKLVKNMEEINFIVGKNFTPGYWTIEASSLGIDSKRLFYVEENSEAEFKLENNTLIITNIGNVIYKKTIQISIGDIVKLQDLNIRVGEQVKYKLLAPDGKYSISISDGVKKTNLGNILLTGRAVDVLEIREQGGILNRNTFAWIFLIILGFGFLIILLKTLYKKKFVGYKPAEKQAKYSEKDIVKKEPDVEIKGEAEHTLVLKGKKQETAVLSLKLDDRENLVDEIIKRIKDKKGVVYKTGGYIIGIFTPSITKSFGNEIIASKLAEDIKSFIEGKNINFGIGINTGNIIVKKEGEKIKFTSLGSTLSLSKKLSNLAKNDILLSESSSKKSRNLIKTEKIKRHGNEIYKIIKIIDRDKNKKFVEEFLRKREKK